MENEIIRKVKESITREERSSMRITRAIRALEAGCYPLAKQAAELCLSDCEWIEQRMAAFSAVVVAEAKDKELTRRFLNEVCGIKGEK